MSMFESRYIASPCLIAKSKRVSERTTVDARRQNLDHKYSNLNSDRPILASRAKPSIRGFFTGLGYCEPPYFVSFPPGEIDNVIIIVFKGFQCCYRGWRDVWTCLVRKVSENKDTALRRCLCRPSAIGLRRAGIDVTVFEAAVGEKVLNIIILLKHCSVKV